MRHLLFVGFVIFLVMLIATPNLFAQIGNTARTAEYLVAESDLVFRASITQLAILERGNSPLPPKDTSNLESVLVTLKITQCFKGTTDNVLQVEVQRIKGNTWLESWKQDHADLYWFVDWKKDLKTGISKVIPYSPSAGFMDSIVVARQPPEDERSLGTLLDVNFRPLNSSQILNETIAAAVMSFGNQKIAKLKIPISRSVAERTGRSGDANFLGVPQTTSQCKNNSCRDKLPLIARTT